MIHSIKDAPEWFWEFIIVVGGFLFLRIVWPFFQWLFKFFWDAQKKQIKDLKTGVEGLRDDFNALESKYGQDHSVIKNDLRHLSKTQDKLVDSVDKISDRMAGMEAVMTRWLSK